MFSDILIRLPGSPMMTPNKGSAKIRALKFETSWGSRKDAKWCKATATFRFCLRSDHLPFFPAQLWCGDASRLNEGQGLGTGCLGVPYAGVSSWLFRFNWEQMAKKKLVGGSNSRNFQRCMMLDDVAWDIQFSRPAADVTHLPLSRHC